MANEEVPKSKMHMQGVQNLCFHSLRPLICGVLVAVVVVLRKRPNVTHCLKLNITRLLFCCVLVAVVVVLRKLPNVTHCLKFNINKFPQYFLWSNCRYMYAHVSSTHQFHQSIAKNCVHDCEDHSFI